MHRDRVDGGRGGIEGLRVRGVVCGRDRTAPRSVAFSVTTMCIELHMID